MRKLFFITIVVLLSSSAFSNNLIIDSISWDPALSQVSFNISWDHSWYDATGDYHDAVWVFVKYAPNGGTLWKHADISAANIPSPLAASVPADQKGAFVKRSSEGYGTVTSTKLTFDVLNTDLGPFPDFKVFGIEMVNIPVGPYYLGGSTTSSIDYHFHRGDDVNEGFLVDTSGILTYGSTTNTWATNTSSGYTTDIPAAYPNGYDQFYAMKYPVTQEQYVEFLNTLTFEQQNARTESDLTTFTITIQYVMTASQTVTFRNGIRADASTATGAPLTFFCDLNENGIANELDDGQNLVLNYINNADNYAYTDWAALRPLTMLEYEKMCRGPLPAVQDEFPWGNAGVTNIYSAASLTNPGEPNESDPAVGSPGPYFNFCCRAGMAATDTSTRITAGAGYYGNLHLASTEASFYIDAKSASYGLTYTGVPGDGILTTAGEYLNSDWGTVLFMTRKGRKRAIVVLNAGTGASQVRSQLHTIRAGR